MLIDSAIILANEKIQELTSDRKPYFPSMEMIEGKPFLEYHFRHLINFGVKNIFLIAGENRQEIYTHFGDNYKTLNIIYIDNEEAASDGSSLKLGFETIESEHFFILCASSLFYVDLHDLTEFYFAYKPDICLTLKRKRDFFRYETVETDVCKVIGFREKQPQSSGLIDGKVYLTNKYLFNSFELEANFSFQKDFLHKHYAELRICAMRSNEEFIDARVASDLEKAKRQLASL